ncbi:MAG TPA: hypothetical protein VGK21_04005 [Candidatus Angelobacter sp.]|jgi:hypothetical protein
MNEPRNPRSAFDAEWFDNGKLKRVRVGPDVLLFMILVLCLLLGRSPVGIWQMLQVFFK